MWIDLNEAETSPFTERYDVCVCGTGPAGMALAQRLMKKGARVLMLEAGGLTYSDDSQAVYQGESIGRNYYGVEGCRLRYFGGTSNHWAGLCGVFNRVDFEQRPIWTLPGWPISHEEAYSELEGALEFLEVAPDDIKPNLPASWGDRGFDGGSLGRSPPTRVGEKYRASVEQASNVDVALNANVTDVALSDDGKRAANLTVQNYRGGVFDVSADYFVIAFGALENARFLLNVQTPDNAGLGNQHDMVGRCFMEHFQLVLARFVSTNQGFWDNIASSSRGRLSLRVTDSLAKQKNLSTTVLALNPNSSPSFGGRLAPLRRFRNKTICSNDFLLETVRASHDVTCSGDGVITTLMEQVPNTSSRISLDERQKDRFGKARLKLDWRFAEQDLFTIRKTAEEIGRSLAQQDFARLKISENVLNGSFDEVLGHCHQMGTTRMSADPRYGVVDSDLKIHGLDNLYVAGSSVFSTGGGVNPTLTIAALSLRLGEHLSRRLRLN